MVQSELVRLCTVLIDERSDHVSDGLAAIVIPTAEAVPVVTELDGFAIEMSTELEPLARPATVPRSSYVADEPAEICCSVVGTKVSVPPEVSPGNA